MRRKVLLPGLGNNEPRQFRIMGIDPGSRFCGLALMSLALPSDDAHYVHLELICPRGPRFGDRLTDLNDRVERVYELYRPDLSVIEATHLAGGKKQNPRTTAQLCKAVGVIERIACAFSRVVYEAKPSSGRLLLGMGNASYPTLRALLAGTYRIKLPPEAVGEDVISAMVQAHALRIVLRENRDYPGVSATYVRKGGEDPIKATVEKLQALTLGDMQKLEEIGALV